ncbi:hypothetical protein ACFLTH_10490 [Bacteroidota bacterium]
MYYLIGIFPITRYETDSMAIANACEEMIQSGHFQENVLGHSYHMQSGTYFLVITLAKILGISAFSSYSILTITFALMYWLFLGLILQKITSVKPALVIITLFLFQEIFALSYYANSAVIASAFWIFSFYLLWIGNNKYNLITAALFLSLAAWCRVDATFTYPSALLLLYMKDNNLKTAILKSFVLGVITVTLTLLLMHMMNANVAGFLGYTQYHGELFGTAHNIGFLDLFVVKAHAAYFSLFLIFLIIISIVTLLRAKKFVLILFLISGILFYYLLGINNAISPKHLSYYTFFWCIIILFGSKYYKDFKSVTRKLLISIGIFLFVIQYLMGIRIGINSIPYQFAECSTLNPYPTLLSTCKINLENQYFDDVEVVLGAGTKIPTPDELAASSGIIFAPLMWYNQKKILYDSFNKMSFLINNIAVDTVTVNVTDGSSQFAINNLLTNGFTWKEKSIDFTSDVQNLTYEKLGSPLIKVTRFSVNKNNFENYLKSFQNEKMKNCYFIFIWPWQNYLIEQLSLPYIETIGCQIHRLKSIK